MGKKIRSLFLFVIIAAVVFCGYEVKRGYDKYALALQECPLETTITKLRSKEHYIVYDDVPEIYYKALVAVEDRQFYKHNGFDIIGTTRAIYNDIRAWELLAGIPNAPSVYSLDVRPDLAKQRHEKVVECMVEVKYITEDKAAEIIGDYK